MKIKIATSELFIAIVACAFSAVVSTTNYSNYDDTSPVDRHASGLKKHPMKDGISGSAVGPPNLEFRRYVDVPETTHLSRRSAHAETAGVIKVTRNPSSTFKYVDSAEYKSILPNYLIPNIRTVGRFTDNAVFVFGYILESPNGNLTPEQYSSLEIIYKAIKRRQVHMYPLLRVFRELENKPSVSQFYTVMVELSKHLPPYLACAANFLVAQIDSKLCDTSAFFTNSNEDLNFLAGISKNDIRHAVVYDDQCELRPYDEVSKVTEAFLGRYFVKIFKLLTDRKSYVSQTVFGGILQHLPNPDDDPVFTESVTFVAELAFEDKIPNWSTDMFKPSKGKDVYDLMDTITHKICVDGNVPKDIKRALSYIRDQFARSAKRTVQQSAHDAYLITRGGIDVDALLDLITPEDFSPRAVRSKVQLNGYIASHPDVVQEVLVGMNRYAYTTPQQLLFAFLTRLHIRLPEEQNEIRGSASSLLLMLLMKRQDCDISRPSGNDITTWMIVEAINNSQIDPEIRNPARKIFNDLLQTDIDWQYMQPLGKKKCYSTEICLRITLEWLISELPAKSLLPATSDEIKRLIAKINVEYGGATAKTPQGGNGIIAEWQSMTTAAGTSSTEPSVVDHATRIQPHMAKTTETTSKKPPTHYYTGTVISSTEFIDTNVEPWVPGLPIDKKKKEPSQEIGSSEVITRKESHINKTIAVSDRKSSDYTMTRRPIITANEGATLKKPSANVYTTTVGPSVTATDETTSKKPSVHYYTTTTRPGTIAVDINGESIVRTPDTNVVTDNPSKVITNVEITTTRKTDILHPRILDTNGPSCKDIVAPTPVNPESSIHAVVPENDGTINRAGGNRKEPNYIWVPSIICLEEKSRAGKCQYECDKDLNNLTNLLETQFGHNYRDVLLGNRWKDDYSMMITWLNAVLHIAEKNDKIREQPEVFREIRRYKLTIQNVALTVLLPIIPASLNLTTEIVWVTYDPKKPSTSYITSNRPDKFHRNMITVPISNPNNWLLPVDPADPFSNLLSNLPENSSYGKNLQLLTTLFKTGKVRDLLGSEFNPCGYMNRGELFTTVMYRLLNQKAVRSDRQLYKIIRRYVEAIEVASVNTHIPDEYLKALSHNSTTEGEPSPDGVDWDTFIADFNNLLSDPLSKSLPRWVYPKMSIHVNVSESGAASIVESGNTTAWPYVVILPSVECLVNKPNPENRRGSCESQMNQITDPLSKTFGKDYVNAILGTGTESRNYTRIGLLVDLFREAEKRPEIQTQPELAAIITRYKIACEFVAAYVVLPIVTGSQKSNTIIIWSTYDSKNHSQFVIGSDRTDALGTNAKNMPLVNPITWAFAVDKKYPLANLLPYLPENDPYSPKLQPLFSLFSSGKINDFLGNRWNSSQYLDRGALFISVLRGLLTPNVNETDPDLYDLVSDYVQACEIPAMYGHVSDEYMKSVFDLYGVPWIKERYIEDFKIPDSIPLPPLINPKKTIQVIIPNSGSPVVESVISKRHRSKEAMILPSVNCLQGASNVKDDEDSEDTCDSVLEFRLTEPLIEVFGDRYVEEILGSDWDTVYPMRMSFLAALLRKAVKNEKLKNDNSELFTKVKAFKEAFEVAVPYIFLPLLANYQKLTTEVVWLTYNYDKPWLSHMGHSPSQYNQTVTLPIVNPEVWLLPVNKDHPFSGFLPDVPLPHSYEEKIEPLRSLLDIKYLRDLTGSSWDPSQYPNRGALFMSAMHTLLKLGPTKLNSSLYDLVRSYYMAIEIPALYLHIPRSYINDAVRKTQGKWAVNLVDLMVALKEPTTDEEHRLRSVLEVWLTNISLLKQLNIPMPRLATSKSTLLTTIIKTALSSTKIQLEPDIKLALQTFQSRILTTGNGAGIIGWTRLNPVIRTTIIYLNYIVSQVVPIDTLPAEKRKGYNDLIQYFKYNSNVLITDDFPSHRYHTLGTFLRGYLNYLLDESWISQEVRENIKSLLPYILYTGPGAQPTRFHSEREK